MREIPLLFSAPMVRAILDGRKTMTRRLAPIEDLTIELHEDDFVSWVVRFSKPIRGVLASISGGRISENNARHVIASQFSPCGRLGDRLWVRETWAQHPDYPMRAIYRADPECEYDAERWKPSIHMPRRYSRITLEITGARVERLQAITEADAIAEGILRDGDGWRGAADLPWFASPIGAFRSLWESINVAASWDANPWVWVVEFKRLGAARG